MSYYRSLSGRAADHIVNYELVTAQGNILQVNRNSSSDLFWALKGGSGNFGFVSRFDLAVYPLIEVYGGNILTDDAPGTDIIVKASASCADPVHGGVSDPLSAVNLPWTPASAPPSPISSTMPARVRRLQPSRTSPASLPVRVLRWRDLALSSAF